MDSPHNYQNRQDYHNINELTLLILRPRMKSSLIIEEHQGQPSKQLPP